MKDTIYRRDAIDALQKEINKGIPPFDDVMGSIRCGVRLARNIIEDLPSAEPERKTGKWVNNINDMPICNQCGYMTPYDRAIDDYEYGNYCPNCGAKMEVQDER